jgi:hypothetical protein
VSGSPAAPQGRLAQWAGRVLAFGTGRKRRADFWTPSRFLRANGASDCPHYVGTLHDHLMRTFVALEARGLARDVCLGGGLHAVYGTSLLQHRMLGHSDRGLVRESFGEGAERLAYLFSMLDRPRTLDAPSALDAETALVEGRDGERLEISRRVFDDLRWMECANLADQDTLNDYPALAALWVGGGRTD